MSDAFPLPPRPNREQYQKLARDLQHACKSGDPAAIRDWTARWVETLARLRAQETTPELNVEIHRDKERVARQWQKFQKSSERSGLCLLADAQFFIALAHGFTSWPKFTAHLEGLASANSAVSSFEIAAD